MVVRQDLGRERRDALLLGDLRQVSEQDRRDPVLLPSVGDEECKLSRMGAEPHVGSVSDDLRGLAGDGHEPEAIGVVDLDRPSRKRGTVGGDILHNLLDDNSRGSSIRSTTAPRSSNRSRRIARSPKSPHRSSSR